MSPNPYQYLLPVSPDAFVGRWPLVKNMAADLLFEGGDSQAIIAGRRCGKSSLLIALAYQLRQTTLPESGNYLALPLLFDFKSSTFNAAGEVFAQLLKEVRRRVDVTAPRRPSDSWGNQLRLDARWFENLADSKALDLREFEDALGYILDQLDTSGKFARLVLLLDEVDETLGMPWTTVLFNQLRALITSSDLRDRVRMVLSGSRRFIDQVSDRSSPLWNVLKLQYLEAFNQVETETLIKRVDGLSDETGLAIWQHSGGHPYLAQFLLHSLWDEGWESTDSNLVESLASRFLHEHVSDIEGWAQAVGATGLRAYSVLVDANDWVEERELIQAVNLQDVKHGLIALCYHGLIIHDKGWEHYKRAGNLFKTWYKANNTAFISSLEKNEIQNQGSTQTGQINVMITGSNSTEVAIGDTSSVEINKGLTADDVSKLFNEIYKAIENRPQDAAITTDEIRETVGKIEEETKKGNEANEGKILRLLRTIKLMAPDIYDVAVAVWTNPVLGTGIVVGKILKKVAETAQKDKV